MANQYRYSRTALALHILLPFSLVLIGCDSSDPSDPDPVATEFLVRYEVTGTCFGTRVYAYNVIYDGELESASGNLTLPWSHEQTVRTAVSPTSTALSAVCSGDGESPQSLTGRIVVDGVERASQSAAGSGHIQINVAANLR